MFAAAAADEARFNTPLPFFKRAGDKNRISVRLKYLSICGKIVDLK